MNRKLEIRSENKELSKYGKKRCTRCEKIYDKSSQFFATHSKKYLRGWCKSCEKLRLEKLRTKTKNDVNWYCNRIVTTLKHRAKTKNIPFDLDGKYLYAVYNKQKGKCYYTDIPLDFTLKQPKKAHKYFPSVDRITPNLGYVKDNIAWCTCEVNKLKNNLSEEQLKNLCNKIVTVLNGKS